MTRALLAAVLLLRASVPASVDPVAVAKGLVIVAVQAGCTPAGIASTVVDQDNGRTLILLRCEVKE